jgi:hypothetical protein
MRRLARFLLSRLPLEYQVLCRQFLLRVVDLEALSIEADIPQFLGQFAGVAIMLSVVHSVIAWAYFAPMPMNERFAYACHFEQYLIATMMLAVGVFTVISWDAVFPDRRDIMVLSPLPVSARTILFAKLGASGGILGLEILALNILSGFAWPFVLGINAGLFQGFLRTCAAWWFTLIAASLFLYSSALAIQGFGALLLPRRLFMRFSALMQMSAFAAILSVYFLQGTLTSPAALAAAQNQWLLASSPSFWFFALFNQLRGVLPPELAWVAHRAWIALGLAVLSGVLSLLLCYLRAMKKTAEEPDLLPAKSGFHWAPRLGGGLQSVVTLFSLRTLMRSRHHRVILAFYLSIAFAIGLAAAHRAMVAGHLRAFSGEFPSVTNLMMVVSVIGFRKVFSIPISLTANWVLRTTQLNPSVEFVAATRNTLLLFSVLPIWIVSALLGLSFQPLHLVAEHLLVLMLIGVILVELSLIRFHKIPFTCSLLPGSTNIQLVFWSGLGGFVLLSVFVISCEMPALRDLNLYAWLVAALCTVAAGLGGFNRYEAKSAVLYFEEVPDEVLTTLHLLVPPSPAGASNHR